MIRFILIKLFIALPMVCFASKEVVASAYNKSIKRPLIVLDAGHGGLDRGAKIKYPYCEEKRLALSTTLALKKYLEQMGYRVSMTRSRDFFVPLVKRVTIANNANSEIFVSIHYNSCPNKTAHGIEVYYNLSNIKKTKSTTSRVLANTVLSKLIYRTKAQSRGVKTGGFKVIKDTKMPAILVECGFLTNAKERDSIRKKIYQEKIAKGIAEGIDNFFK